MHDCCLKQTEIFIKMDRHLFGFRIYRTDPENIFHYYVEKKTVFGRDGIFTSTSTSCNF